MLVGKVVIYVLPNSLVSRLVGDKVSTCSNSRCDYSRIMNCAIFVYFCTLNDFDDSLDGRTFSLPLQSESIVPAWTCILFLKGKSTV